MSEEFRGANFSLQDGVITFFDVEGGKLAGGQRWVLNISQVGWESRSPESILGAVDRHVTNAITRGNERRIVQLRLKPEKAVILFLEGALTGKDLKRAREGKGYILIPNVRLEGRTLTVYVQQYTLYSMVITDSRGNPLSESL